MINYFSIFSIKQKLIFAFGGAIVMLVIKLVCILLPLFLLLWLVDSYLALLECW